MSGEGEGEGHDGVYGLDAGAASVAREPRLAGPAMGSQWRLACGDRQCSYNVSMADQQFEWDERKNRANQTKHGIGFEEARTAFLDENARVMPDPDHSDDEDRFILLGLSIRLRVIVVCHCYRAQEAVIRIISARKATAAERSDYMRWLS